MTLAFGLKRGTVVGQYRIIRLLGKGGMGVVYEAFEEGLNRRVAIKMMNEESLQDPDSIKRFELEGQALARIHHPNVVTVFNLGRYLGVPYLAMEYIEGVSLRDYLEKRIFPVKEAIPLFQQLLLGVEALHKNGILHRDLKPHNIIYLASHEVKIVDFGVAKMMLSPGSEITGAGIIVGSAKYISPEGARGEPVTAQSDIWSLGVLFYQMLMGETPFEAETQREVLRKVRSLEVEFPIFSKLVIPKEIRAIILKMLQRQLEKRFLNSSQVLESLNKYFQLNGQTKDYRPQNQIEISSNLNIKNEKEFYSRLQKYGYDTFRTKLVLTLALNEQAKMDIQKSTLSEETEMITGSSEITISDQAVEVAIRSLEDAAHKSEGQVNVERRKAPRNVAAKPPPSSNNFRYFYFALVSGALVGLFIYINFVRAPLDYREISSVPSEPPVMLAPVPVQPSAEQLRQNRIDEQEQRAKFLAATEAKAKVEAEAKANADESRRLAEAQAVERRALEKRTAERLAAEKKAAEKLAAEKKAVVKKAADKKVEARRAAVKRAPARAVPTAKIHLAPPDILSPLNETTVARSNRAPASVLFIWRPQASASSYDIEYSMSKNFSEPFLSQNVKSSQYSLDRALPYGTIYWRIRARDKNIYSEWSQPQSLIIALPDF